MAGSPGCSDCLSGLIKGPATAACLECMGKFPCPDHPGSIPVIYFTVFRGVSRDLVHMVKYGSRRELGRLIGRTMGRAYIADISALLMAVPLHAGSERTFNQSLELARGMADVWGASSGDSLEWRISRPTQVGLSSGARKSLPQNAIRWKGRPPENKNIYLVDDVCTTGATLRSSVQAVKVAGGSVSCAFVWAMTRSGTGTPP